MIQGIILCLKLKEWLRQSDENTSGKVIAKTQTMANAKPAR